MYDNQNFNLQLKNVLRFEFDSNLHIGKPKNSRKEENHFHIEGWKYDHDNRTPASLYVMIFNIKFYIWNLWVIPLSHNLRAFKIKIKIYINISNNLFLIFSLIEAPFPTFRPTLPKIEFQEELNSVFLKLDKPILTFVTTKQNIDPYSLYISFHTEVKLRHWNITTRTWINWLYPWSPRIVESIWAIWIWIWDKKKTIVLQNLSVLVFLYLEVIP